jgi:hypothetical protein
MRMILRRVGSSEAAAAYLRRQARNARDVVGPFSSGAVAALQAEAATLPDRCDLFSEALLTTPALAAGIRDLRRAVRRGESPAGLRHADTAEARVSVAKTFVALREAGLVDEHLVAAALLQLIDGRSPITEAALMRAAAGGEAVPAVAGPSRATITATA